MKITDHIAVNETDDPVVAVDLLKVNVRPGNGAFKPRFLIIHYTVSSTAQSSLSWFKNKNASASAHFIIDRNGDIIQCVSCSDIAFHAGVSSWNGLDRLNGHSIGIELVNSGVLRQNVDGSWIDAYGRPVPSDQVISLPHKVDGVVRGWQTYPTEQLESCEILAAALVDEYKLSQILGHDDISPRRKLDPGPAFPMDSFRAKVHGRLQDDPELYASQVALNVRQGPSTEHTVVTTIAAGTRVEKIQQSGTWFLIEVVDRPDIQGWVNSRFLRSV